MDILSQYCLNDSKCFFAYVRNNENVLCMWVLCGTICLVTVCNAMHACYDCSEHESSTPLVDGLCSLTQSQKTYITLQTDIQCHHSNIFVIM